MLRAAVVLIILFLANPAFASLDFYGNCIYSFDFGVEGEAGITAITVPPIGRLCKERCEQDCGKPISPSEFSGGLSRKSTATLVELNSDVILQCLADCQTGKTNRQYFIREDQAVKGGAVQEDIRYIGPITVDVTCGDASNVSGAGANAIWTNVTVKDGEKIEVHTIGGAFDNKVYMCGRKMLSIRPLVKSLDDTVWMDRVNQTLWPDPSKHKCLTDDLSKTTTAFASLTNRMLWDKSYTTPFDEKSTCMWHARNSIFTETGFYIADGDEFSISWSGDYASFFQNNSAFSRYNTFTILANPAATQADKTSASSNWKNISGIQINTATQSLYGEDARLRSPVDTIGKMIPADQNLQISNPYIWKGLSGSTSDLGVQSIELTSAPDCDTADKRTYNHNLCHTTSNPGDGFYKFSGVLSGFSTSRIPLKLRHWTNPSVQVYSDNAGGYDVDINWGGCPLEHGNGLEYAILTNYSSVQGTSETERFTAIQAEPLTWISIPESVLKQDQELTVQGTGMLLLRIAPPATSNSTDPNIQALYNTGNRFGTYVVAIKKTEAGGFLNYNGPLRSLVNYVHNVLFGIKGYDAKHATPNSPSSATPSNKESGVVKILYETFIQHSGIKAIIQAFLTMYFAFLGIGFITGAVQMTQREAVVRSFTVAVVIALVSDQSWNLINTYFFPFFTDGVTTLIAIFVMGAITNVTGFTEEMVREDPSLIFAVFDGTIKQLFSAPFWSKMGTLILSGVLGIWVFLVSLMAVVMYLWAVLKAVIMYLMAMIITATLMLVSPIFIPFALFKETKELFDNWWKSLINFAIQPIALFLGIAIFEMLFAIAFISSFSFTICPTCHLLIDLNSFGVDWKKCLWPGYAFLNLMHLPDGTEAWYYLPPRLFFLSMVLLIIAHAMEEFVDFLPGLISSIVAGNLTDRATNIAGYGSAARVAVTQAAITGVRVGVVKPAAAIYNAPDLAKRTVVKSFQETRSRKKKP